MDVQPKTLHVVFFPYMAPGHMIPILDLAHLFASNGVKSTIITTPFNAHIFLKPLERSKHINPSKINIEIIPFPSEEVGLPKGVENSGAVTSLEMHGKFRKATQMLQPALELVLHKLRPDFLIADLLLPFATRAAKKFDIPRIVFHTFGCFPICCARILRKYQPFRSVEADDEEFVIPHLPHVIKSTRSQLSPDVVGSEVSYIREMIADGFEAEEQSYGVIVNSFLELEEEYVELYKRITGKKTRVWLVGPALLFNKENYEANNEVKIDEDECLRWLDSKRPNSVVYVCFGTLTWFTDDQLCEIAKGLEASGQDFIWVVRRGKDQKREDEWLLEEFEERIKGKGLVIRGWATQTRILEHESVGGFVTHCGWNSVLEGVSCGTPMVTWPVFSDQFYNEKLVTEVLKIGVAVGAKKWSRLVDGSVKWEGIKEAIKRVMVSEEGFEMRNRAKKLKEMARQAVREGGSSYSDLRSLIQELRSSADRF